MAKIVNLFNGGKKTIKTGIVRVNSRNVYPTNLVALASTGLSLGLGLPDSYDFFNVAQTSASTDLLILPNSEIGTLLELYAVSSFTVKAGANGSGLTINGAADTASILVPTGSIITLTKITSTNWRGTLGTSTSAGATVTTDTAGVNRLVINPTPKTIVDGSATSLADVACAAGATVGGTLTYNVISSDGTDFQSLTGLVTYSAVNKAGTLTLTITEVAGNQAKAVSAGTLTLAWTFVTGASKGTIKLQPTGSLTETTYTVTYTILPLSGAVTIL